MGILMRSVTVSFVFLLLLAGPALSFAQPFRIALLESEEGASEKYLPLVKYLKKKGIDASFVPAKNYIHVSKMFESDQADGMFSSASIAGVLIIKDVALPVVRPVTRHGWSTSWAVVVGAKGSPKFEENAAYFNGKNVAFTSFDLSGDFFYRAIQGIADSDVKVVTEESHVEAVEAISRGVADVAIINNRVWDKIKAKYAGLEIVGEGSGKNPERTLVFSKKTDVSTSARVKEILLALERDKSAEAKAVKTGLDIKGYAETTLEDFSYAISILEKAGVSK